MTGAHYPTPFDEKDEPEALIGHEHITIGDAVLSTRYIEAGSVIVQPGDANNLNRVTLTLFVSDITIDPDAINKVRVNTPDTEAR